MDGEGSLRVCGDGVASDMPRIDGQLLKKGQRPRRGKAQEDPKENDKPISFSFHR